LDYEELASSVATEESEELWLPQEFPPELVREGQEKELTSMKDFGVYRLVSLDQTTPEEQRKAIPTRWVETWKGDKVKCRLVAKDLKVKDLYRDKDELYAATPAFVTRKVMLTLALANRWGVWSLDIGTAFFTRSFRRTRGSLYGLLKTKYSSKDTCGNWNRPCMDFE
jgi:hypothetical protein